MTQFYALVTFAQAEALDEPLYFDLLSSFCDLASSDSSIPIRLIGLHALEGVVSAEYYHTGRFKAQNALVMKALLRDLAEARISNGEIDLKA